MIFFLVHYPFQWVSKIKLLSLLAHKLTTQIDSFFERTVQGKSNPLAHYRLILRPAPLFFHQLNRFLDLVHEIKKKNSLYKFF
ncbi:hypothetical protein L6452_32724 [Arctium lappa]|uniref:Uncharacterized protein n=1 Tax=Arctium lappa TaxID=4217 RepID=A0ACB8Z5F0_ARCLA|nr:hypothetical protein L6452_32724 [Arctium lappa]